MGNPAPITTSGYWTQTVFRFELISRLFVPSSKSQAYYRSQLSNSKWWFHDWAGWAWCSVCGIEMPWQCPCYLCLQLLDAYFRMTVRYDVTLSVQWSPVGASAVYLIDASGMTDDNKISVSVILDSNQILSLASQPPHLEATSLLKYFSTKFWTCCKRCSISYYYARPWFVYLCGRLTALAFLTYLLVRARASLAQPTISRQGLNWDLLE